MNPVARFLVPAIWSVAILLLAAGPVSAQNPDELPDIGAIDAFVEEQMEAHDLPGAAIAITKGDEEHLVALHVGQGPPKERLMQLSTLLPMLAHWHAVLDMGAEYEAFRNSVIETFGETTLSFGSRWRTPRSTCTGRTPGSPAVR